MSHASPGTRICVIGTSGCGKTHVAQALARKMGLTYISCDAVIHRADWQPTPPDERLAEIDRATSEAANGWTFDGNLAGPPDHQLLLARCDTLVWLDLPRWQVHGQVIRRSLRRVVTRERLWHGNVETWGLTLSRESVIWWSITSFRPRRERYRALFADPRYADKARVRLGSRREIDTWLEGLRQGDTDRGRRWSAA